MGLYPYFGLAFLAAPEEVETPSGSTLLGEITFNEKTVDHQYF
jgi:hypothetical protein